MSYHSLEDRLVKHFMRSGNFDDDVKRDMKAKSKRLSTPRSKRPLSPTTPKWKPTPAHEARAFAWRNEPNGCHELFGFLRRSKSEDQASQATGR